MFHMMYIWMRLRCEEIGHSFQKRVICLLWIVLAQLTSFQQAPGSLTEHRRNHLINQQPESLAQLCLQKSVKQNVSKMANLVK